MVAALCADSSERGFAPTIVCYDPVSEKIAQIPCNAPIIQLDRKEKAFSATLSAVLAAFDIVHAQGHISAYYLSRAGYRGTKLATMHIGMEQSWRWLLQVRSGLRAMDYVTAVSAPMASLYRQISGRRVDMVANGVKLVDFGAYAAHPPAAGAPFRFVMMSRLHKVKRHIDAIAAIDCLTAAGQNVELVIAGEGPEMAYLQNFAATRPYIRLIGAVSDIAPFLASHHALILCSEHEGTPVTLIEAMALGLPIIASDVGGIACAVGDAAILIAPKHSNQLAMAMMRLVSDHALWLQQSQHSRQQALGFDAAFMADHYAALYGKLLMR